MIIKQLLEALKVQIPRIEEPENPCPEGDICSACAYSDGYSECIKDILEIDLPMEFLEEEKLAEFFRENLAVHSQGFSKLWAKEICQTFLVPRQETET